MNPPLPTAYERMIDDIQEEAPRINQESEIELGWENRAQKPDEYQDSSKINRESDERITQLLLLNNGTSNNTLQPSLSAMSSTAEISSPADCRPAIQESQIELGWEGRKAQPTKTRRICCCFSSFTGCILVFLFLMILLSMVAFIAFPRLPTITSSSPYAKDVKDNLKFNTTASGNITALSFDVLVDFNVTSENYWAYYASEIVTIGKLLDSNDTEITNSLAYGEIKGASFLAKASSSFTMQLTLYWTTVGLTVDQDPVLERLKACTYEQPFQTCKLTYSSKVTLPIVSWLGIYFTPGGSFTVNLNSMSVSSRDSVKLISNSILNAFNPIEFPLNS